ncbi:MAG TPA: DUF559 domain-containing protein [Deinococcales bacterium]|nr:DUF559 domain-containing protein [Deinococcales bacterium]
MTVRRQHPIGPYIADFAIPAFRLIVELDGEQHFESGHDTIRDAWLAAHAWSVLRFWNRELLDNPEGAVRAVLEALRERGAPVMGDRGSR